MIIMLIITASARDCLITLAIVKNGLALTKNPPQHWISQHRGGFSIIRYIISSERASSIPRPARR